MRTIIALTACLAAGIAFADTEIEVKPIRLEAGAAAPADTADTARETNSAGATRAQDYNSSRSNTTSLRQSDDPVLRKRPGRTTAKTEAVQPSRPPSRAVSAQDYNSSRSNIGAAGPVDNDEDSDSDLMYDGCERTVGDGVDDDCDGVRGTAAPANHNTTRSNRTID